MRCSQEPSWPCCSFFYPALLLDASFRASTTSFTPLANHRDRRPARRIRAVPSSTIRCIAGTATASTTPSARRVASARPTGWERAATFVCEWSEFLLASLPLPLKCPDDSLVSDRANSFAMSAPPSLFVSRGAKSGGNSWARGANICWADVTGFEEGGRRAVNRCLISANPSTRLSSTRGISGCSATLVLELMWMSQRILEERALGDSHRYRTRRQTERPGTEQTTNTMRSFAGSIRFKDRSSPSRHHFTAGPAPG